MYPTLGLVVRGGVRKRCTTMQSEGSPVASWLSCQKQRPEKGFNFLFLFLFCFLKFPIEWKATFCAGCPTWFCFNQFKIPASFERSFGWYWNLMCVFCECVCALVLIVAEFGELKENWSPELSDELVVKCWSFDSSTLSTTFFGFWFFVLLSGLLFP